MKSKGLAQYIQNLVLFDGLSNAEEKAQAEEAVMKVYTLDEVMEIGRSKDVKLEPEKV